MIASRPVNTTAPPQQPSLRALIAGFVLAVLLCGVNSYLTLSFGVIEEGPTIAALFFFAFFFLSSVKITTTEMAIVATMGSAGGSLGFITNFFAAQAMVGTPYSFWQMAGFSIVTSLVGMSFVVPLRQMLILRENLPWPGSKATEAVIRALVEKGDPKQPWYLLASTLACIAIVVLNTDGGFGVIPDGSEIPLFGLAAFGLGIAWSPFAIGGAYLMGFRTCIGFLVGGCILLIMAPHLPTPAAPHRYVWPGIGFLVSTGITLMLVNWRVVVSSVKSLVSIRGSNPDDDDPVLSVHAPPRLHGSIGMVVDRVVLVFWASVSPLVVVLLLVVVGGFLQNVIATRAAAQTAFNPARVMGVLLQGVTAMAGGSSAATNLAGAGFVAGSGAQAGNLTGDMAYGRWLKVPSRWQFWAQTLTIVPCAVVSAYVFEWISKTKTIALDGGDLPAPVAKMWAATALIFDGSTPMPPGAMKAMAIAAAVGVVYVVLEENQKLHKYLPSSVGIGIALVLPVAYDFAFFLGGLVFWGLLGKGFKVKDLTLTTLAVGAIVGEGLGGVMKPVLQMLKVIKG